MGSKIVKKGDVKTSKKTASAKKPLSKDKKVRKKSVENISNPSISAAKMDGLQESVAQPVEKPVSREITIPPVALWVTALGLGLSFDFLFWDQIPGINYAIFLVLCVVGGLIVLASSKSRPAFGSLVLLIPLIFFAVFSFLRREPLTSFLAYALSLFSLGMFAVTYLGGRWYFYSLSTYIYKFFHLIVDMVWRPFGYFSQIQKKQLNDGGNEKKSPFWGLIRGLLIALPIVFCLGSLLASGDLVFNQKLSEFFEDVTAEKIAENTQRILLIAGCAYFASGVFIHSFLNSRDEKISGGTPSLLKPFLGFTETSVVLASVCVLFMFFVGVQFKYFFGGETNIGVAGYSYSQYARRGFNELITVAFISLMIVIGLRGAVRLENQLQRRINIGLNILLIGLVLIILVSAYQRISLGIDWHGYSRLRLYPRFSLIWLGALFIAIAILLAVQKERFFAFALVLAAFGFAATVSLFNIDASTVKHNVYRAWHGKNLNVSHLASLSDDAIPALVEEYLSPALPESTRDGVGAILACYAYFEDNPHISPYDWRSFNLAGWQAHKALNTVRPHLKGYFIIYERRPIQVKTPTDALYNCVYYPNRDLEEEE